MDFQGQKLCECGCGAPAPIATITATRAGRIKGQPSRFVRGHNSRVRAPNASKKAPYVVDENGCWVWQRCKQSGGYGRMWNGSEVVQAHRHYYAEKHGPLTPDLHLHHTCGNRACVNPDHLEPLSRIQHGAHHGKERAEMVRIVMASGLSLDEVARRLGVV